VSRARVPGARPHQRGQFARGDGAATRQPLALVGLDFADTAVFLTRHGVGVARLPREAPEHGERQVDRRWRGPLVCGAVGLHKALPDARDLGGAQVVPGEGRGVWDLEEAGNGAQAFPDGLLTGRREAVDVGVHRVGERVRGRRRLAWLIEERHSARLAFAHGHSSASYVKCCAMKVRTAFSMSSTSRTVNWSHCPCAALLRMSARAVIFFCTRRLYAPAL